MDFSLATNGLVACAVAELKVGSLMKVPKVERTYLLEPLHKAAIAQLPRVMGWRLNYVAFHDKVHILRLASL